MSIIFNKELLFFIISEQINNECSFICKIIKENKNISKDKLTKLVKEKINKDIFEKEILKLKNQKFINSENDFFSLNDNNILQVLKYPKFLFLINMLFGEKANNICEIFMEFGICNFNQLIQKLELKNVSQINEYINIFLLLIEREYLIKEKENFLEESNNIINTEIKNHLINYKTIVK